MKYTGERIIPEIPDCGPGTLLFETHLARYQFAAPFVLGRRTLDIACGVGYGSSYLADNGAASVIGADLSREAIHYAAMRYSTVRSRYVVASAEEMPLASASIDTVVSFETLEHVLNADGFLREIARILVPQGRLILSTPNKVTYGRGNSVPDNPFHTREYTLKEFKELVSQFFPALSLFAQRQRIRSSVTGSRVDSLVRRMRHADRLGLRRFLPRGLRGLISRNSDAYEQDSRVVPLQQDDEPLFFIAVAGM